MPEIPGTGGAHAGFFGAGDESGNQYGGVEGERRGHFKGSGDPENRTGEIPRASSECGMSSPPANPNPVLSVISGPSGGGKTTLCEELLAKRPNIIRAITCTTRDPRKGEKDGVDYYFLDAATFLKRVQAGNFLEHA